MSSQTGVATRTTYARKVSALRYNFYGEPSALQPRESVFERAVHRNHIEPMLLLRVSAVSYCQKCSSLFVTDATTMLLAQHEELSRCGSTSYPSAS